MYVVCVYISTDIATLGRYYIDVGAGLDGGARSWPRSRLCMIGAGAHGELSSISAPTETAREVQAAVGHNRLCGDVHHATAPSHRAIPLPKIPSAPAFVDWGEEEV